MKYRHQYPRRQLCRRPQTRGNLLRQGPARARTQGQGIPVRRHTRGPRRLRPPSRRPRASRRMGGGAARLLAAAPRHGARGQVRYRDHGARAHGGSLRRARRCSPRSRCGLVDRAVFFETQREEAGAPAQAVLSESRRARASKARMASPACAGLLPLTRAARLCAHRPAVRGARGPSRACTAAVSDTLQRFESAVAGLVAAGETARATSTRGSRTLRAAVSPAQCSRPCCGYIRGVIHAPRSTARRWCSSTRPI